MSKQIEIIKRSGEKEIFSEQKYVRALRRVGCSDELISEILKEISSILRDGMTTEELYNETARILKKKESGLAGRYNLKQAILKFGPTGYPFERFVASLFKYQGYKVSIDKIASGKCVNHEIDVIAEKDDKRILIECKFHNVQSYYCGVKIPLYIKARFDDINESSEHKGKGKGFDECLLVTNTRFTSEAINYAECVGIKMIGWRHPKDDGIQDIIEKLGLYPISCLTKLSKRDIDILLKNEIVLCHDILKNLEKIRGLHISENAIDNMILECQALVKGSL